MASHPNGDAALAKATCRQSASPHNSARWLTTLILAGCGVSLCLASPQVSAQGRKSSPTINVSPQLRLSPGMENKLEISFAPGDAIPPSSVVVIRGVPPDLRLSEGRPFGPGVWVVPATQIMTIKLQMPLEARVGGVLTIALTTLEGVSMAEAHITLLTTPPSRENAGKAASPPAGRDDTPTSATIASEQQPSPSPPKLSTENRAQLLLLLEKGKDSYRLGNILHARQFYLRAAEKGLAEAAFALAATYDPGELSRMKAVGVAPDTGLARKWYEKAKQLGSPEAAARLSALSRQ